MDRAVVLAPEARIQLLHLYRYLADNAGTTAADRISTSVLAHCQSLSEHSMRGTRRDDIRPGLRLTHYKKRAVIAYVVEDSRVTVLGIFHGRQDFESRLRGK